jgi:hypothetical protein
MVPDRVQRRVVLLTPIGGEFPQTFSSPPKRMGMYLTSLCSKTDRFCICTNQQTRLSRHLEVDSSLLIEYVPSADAESILTLVAQKAR